MTSDDKREKTEQSLLPATKNVFSARGGKVLSVGMLAVLGLNMLGSMAEAHETSKRKLRVNGETVIVPNDDVDPARWCIFSNSECTGNHCTVNCNVNCTVNNNGNE